MAGKALTKHLPIALPLCIRRCVEGALQKATLVLVNGRRMASYGFAQNLFDTFVDLNSIPAPLQWSALKSSGMAPRPCMARMRLPAW